MIPIVLIIIGVVLSGLFSGAETGMYQLSRVRLRLAVEQRQRLSQLLALTLQDGPGLLVATLLGTNFSVYVTTSTVTMMLLKMGHAAHTAEWAATLMTTPFLFIFSELIPKNLFLFRADVLMPIVSPILYASYKILYLCGAIPLLQAMASLFARLTRMPKPSKVAAESLHRHEIAAILRDTQEEGFMSGLQTGIMNRLVIASTTPVKAVMTRIHQVEKVDIHCDRDTLLKMLTKHDFTRVLVYQDVPDNILGFINVYQVLGINEPFSSLHAYIKSIQSIAADTFVTEAIDRMQHDMLKILLVVGSLGGTGQKPLGIVTMKDLAEELLGELAVW